MLEDDRYKTTGIRQQVWKRLVRENFKTTCTVGDNFQNLSLYLSIERKLWSKYPRGTENFCIKHEIHHELRDFCKIRNKL